MNNPKLNKFVVIGGTGYLGRFLIKELLTQYPGCDIEIVTRNLSKAIFFDSDNVTLKKNIQDVDLQNAVLFNLAFEQGVGFKDTQKKTELLVKNIKFALNKGTIQKLIHISSIVVQGKNLSKEMITPKALHKVSKNDPYCYAKGLIEKALCRFANFTKTPIIIVRSGNIIGPGSIWAQKLIIRLIEGAPVIAKNKVCPSNTTFVGNIAWALSQLASPNIKLPQKISIMNFAEFGNISWEEWINLIVNVGEFYPKVWQHNSIEALKPRLKRDLKQIFNRLVMEALPVFAKGSATNKIAIKISDLGKASDVKEKAKSIVSVAQKEGQFSIDIQEYSMALIFLNKIAFGTEGVPQSIAYSLPYSKKSAGRAISNWIHFASYR